MRASNGPATLDRPGPWPTPVPEASTMADATFSERFWSKVDRSAGPNGCWLWLSSKSSRARRCKTCEHDRAKREWQRHKEARRV
jgi:hypothetical protein